jgi:hypothetical protein
MHPQKQLIRTQQDGTLTSHPTKPNMTLFLATVRNPQQIMFLLLKLHLFKRQLNRKRKMKRLIFLEVMMRMMLKQNV